MIKGIEMMKRAEEVKKSVSKRDSARYILLSLIGLTWALYEYFSTNEAKLLDILMMTVVGLLYILNEKQSHSFLIALHSILDKAENASNTIRSLTNLTAKLNEKVKNDEVYKKRIDDTINEHSDIISNLIKLLRPKGGA